MNRPSPKTVRRRFLMALGHVVHVTWPVLSTIASSNAAHTLLREDFLDITRPVPTRSSYEGTQAHQPVWRRAAAWSLESHAPIAMAAASVGRDLPDVRPRIPDRGSSIAVGHIRGFLD